MQKLDGQAEHAEHGVVPDVRATPTQMQLAVSLSPRGNDGDMHRSRRVGVSRPGPCDPGGRQPQIGPQEAAHAIWRATSRFTGPVRSR